MFSTELNQFPRESRVWVYLSSRELTPDEAASTEKLAKRFVAEWTSHNRQLRAHAECLHGRFLVLMVDESEAGASGCGIDKSVKFVKDLGAQLGTDFFDRMLFAYREAESVRVVGREEFSRLYAEGRIGAETPVFNTLVQQQGELLDRFVLPLHRSWHARMV
jgi:hypothetical protein